VNGEQVNMTTRSRLGLRAFARHRGVSPSRIHRLVIEGVIPRDADGLIDVAVADGILDQRARLVSPLVAAANAATKRRQASLVHSDGTIPIAKSHAHGGRATKRRNATTPASVTAKSKKRSQNEPPPTDTSSYTFARTERERALAKQAQLDYRRSVGEVCEVKSAARAVDDCAVATRRLIEQIPNRIVNQLSAALGVDARTVHGLMQVEVERILEAIADVAAALPEKLMSTEH
jgi:hypothetical protein